LLEQEVKLAFSNLEAARQAVHTAGGRLVVSRRLLVDTLFASPDGLIPSDGRTLRLRRDGDRAYVTFKGPALPGPVKIREELETGLGDADTGDRILAALGYRPFFRSEKYREEYALDDVHIAIDDAPIGVFVEIEGTATSIERATRLLGLTPADYRLESYQRLHAEWCRTRGVSQPNMVFAESP
jgi:adenylate cyclase class 2